MDGLHDHPDLAPFLTKTFDMVDDPETDSLVSWSSCGSSFVVWSPLDFAREILPKYFKHHNFSSFLRQLNIYGFRKVDPDRWEYANEGFLRGKRHLLKSIRRRKPPAHHQASHGSKSSRSLGACLELGHFGLLGDVERLKRDKKVLMAEIVKLRQQQQQTERELQMMNQRLHVTDQRQQQVVSFLARAMHKPGFLAQILQMNESTKLLGPARKKCRLTEPDTTQDGNHHEAQGQLVRYFPTANESTLASLQFLNTGSSGSQEDVPLEVLFRDLYTGPIAKTPSGVVLTEMHGDHGVSDELDIAEFPAELANQSVDPLLRELPEDEHLGSKSVPEKWDAECMDAMENTSQGEGGTLMPSDAGIDDNLDMHPPEDNLNVDSGGGIEVNDGFWEQFFRTNVNSKRTETDPYAPT